MTTTITSNIRKTARTIGRRIALPVLAGAVAISSISAAMWKADRVEARQPLVALVMPKTAAVAKLQPAIELMHDATIAAIPAAIPAPIPATPKPGMRIVMMEVTAYCPCPRCCGPNAAGITASGKDVRYNAGRFVAADRALPFGTKLIVPGYGDGQAVEVIDRGGAIKGNKLDVFFPTHEQALKWGRQHVAVTVFE